MRKYYGRTMPSGAKKAYRAFDATFLKKYLRENLGKERRK